MIESMKRLLLPSFTRSKCSFRILHGSLEFVALEPVYILPLYIIRGLILFPYSLVKVGLMTYEIFVRSLINDKFCTVHQALMHTPAIVKNEVFKQFLNCHLTIYHLKRWMLSLMLYGSL